MSNVALETSSTLFRYVWILARSLSGSQWLPNSSQTSDGQFPLCHWAVLVTHLDSEIIEGAIDRASDDYEDICLGRLLELLCYGKSNIVNSKYEFRFSQLNNEWLNISAQFVGRTILNDDTISLISALLFRQRLIL